MNNLLRQNCFFSKCRKYRWFLDIKISRSPNEIIFIGLNPSLSNHNFQDNTTKKIIKICGNAKYGRVKIINLFGLISKTPKLLLSHEDPIGELNNNTIICNLDYWSRNMKCDIWLGWGNKGKLFGRNIHVLTLLNDYYGLKKINFINPLPPLIIKKTKNLQPIHPLYCSDKSELQKSDIFKE